MSRHKVELGKELDSDILENILLRSAVAMGWNQNYRLSSPPTKFVLSPVVEEVEENDTEVKGLLIGKQGGYALLISGIHGGSIDHFSISFSSSILNTL
jgi:hypothetical protein